MWLIGGLCLCGVIRKLVPIFQCFSLKNKTSIELARLI